MCKLATDRLTLRRFTPDDWRDLYEYLSDEEVVKYEPYHAFTEEACKKEAARRSDDPAFRAVCLKETGKLIGNLYFARQKPDEFLTWELGYVFNRGYWGKGYAAESCKRLLAHGFASLGARRIIAMCNPENANSWHLLVRLGMRREAHLKQSVYFKYDELGSPIWLDTYAYALLKEEWLALPGNSGECQT